MSPYMSHGVKCLHAYHTAANVSMPVTQWKISPCMSHDGQCLHACHMVVNVSKQIFMTQTFKTCVCGEANFQLANFHNINFQSGVEWSGEFPICKLPKHKLPTCRLPTHDSQCLHACQMTVNVFMHTTWYQMSPYISHRGKCLHTYHMVVNVSIHITQR